VLIELLYDIIVLEKAKEEELGFLFSTDANIDLALYGKLSWEDLFGNEHVLLSWQIGDDAIEFYRKPGQVFENRIKIKV
jgi:hypothetical protein